MGGGKCQLPPCPCVKKRERKVKIEEDNRRGEKPNIKRKYEIR